MKLKDFIELIRIPSLTASIIPAIIGYSISNMIHSFNLWMWIDILCIAILMQISTNIFNEHGDFIKGVDRQVSHGFAGLLLRGLAKPEELLILAVIFDLIALILSIPLIIIRGAVLLLLGIISFSISLLYSEGPLPISKTPLGEITAGIFMGFLLLIIVVFVSAGIINQIAIIISIPVSLLVADILIGNNIRDIEKDKMALRTTMPIMVGKKNASYIFYAIPIIAYAFPIVLFLNTREMRYLISLTGIPITLFLLFKTKKDFINGVEIASLIYLIYGILLSFTIIY